MKQGTVGAGMAAVIATVLVAAGQASGQCQLLTQESFRPGLRPHGGNGQLREAQIHDTLKDYWPQVPSNGTRWIAADGGAPVTWAFAGSSLDPAEVDPQDPFNGTAFGEAPAAAVLPFTPATSRFMASAEVVMGFQTNSTVYLGYTSSPVTQSNFEAFGTLWMSLNGFGDWAIYANGSIVVASGTAPIAGTLDSGWLHVDLTFDPVTSRVSGHVMNTTIAPTPVTLTRPILYFGMEAHNSWSVVNNISVSMGEALSVSVAGGGFACEGATATLSAATNATGPSVIHWTNNDGWPLADGPQPGGSVFSGVQTPTLTISNASASDAGPYRCIVASSCGYVMSDPVTLVVRAGGYPNCDGSSAAPVLNVNDFTCFLNRYAAGDSYANCDGSSIAPVLNVNDFTCFMNRYAAACP